MTQIELIADSLRRNLEMLKMTLADFSDADMLVRPCPGANHAAWQLGHLINSEARIMTAIRPGSMPALPAGFAERYTPETAKLDDPAAFLSKNQAIEQLGIIRAASIAAVQALSQKDLDTPTPERLQRLGATVGQLLLMLPGHVTMHLGQMQVIRRKLGKPVLF